MKCYDLVHTEADPGGFEIRSELTISNYSFGVDVSSSFLLFFLLFDAYKCPKIKNPRNKGDDDCTGTIHIRSVIG